MITKLLIVALSIVTCSMIGLMLHKNSLQKVKYYESLIAFINTLTSEIKFRQSSLKVVIQEFIKNNNTSLNVHLQEFYNFLQGETSTLILSKKLKQEETETIANFFSTLGTCDDTTQLFELENYKSKFEAIYLDKETKHKKFGGLYLKLSFLCGIAIGVLII